MVFYQNLVLSFSKQGFLDRMVGLYPHTESDGLIGSLMPGVQDYPFQKWQVFEEQ